MDDSVHPEGTFSAHRIEALTDGVFAIAMTLLVIELKLPDPHAIRDAEGLARALAELSPKAIAWTISFGVLAFFWVGHHRVFRHALRTDGPLLTLNLAELAVVTLMPFSCSLIGEFPRSLVAQAIYSANMFLLGATALAVARYIRRHPALGSEPMSEPMYESARMRIGAVMLISILASLIGSLFTAPVVGNIAFMLMVVINPLSRRIERRKMAALRPAPAAGPAPSGGA